MIFWTAKKLYNLLKKHGLEESFLCIGVCNEDKIKEGSDFYLEEALLIDNEIIYLGENEILGKPFVILPCYSPSRFAIKKNSLTRRDDEK